MLDESLYWSFAGRWRSSLLVKLDYIQTSNALTQDLESKIEITYII